jgi:hypothetical protein
VMMVGTHHQRAASVLVFGKEWMLYGRRMPRLTLNQIKEFTANSCKIAGSP